MPRGWTGAEANVDPPAQVPYSRSKSNLHYPAMSVSPPGTYLSAASSNRPHPDFRDVQFDSAHLLPETITFATVTDCGFKGTRFDRLSFKFVTFVRCYFRDASFTTVEFEGCRFIDCNFHGAQFTASSLDYSEFANCNLTFDQVRECLPVRDNIRLPLARNLKSNASARGDTDDAREFLLVELTALRAVNFGIAFKWTDNYYRKFPFTAKARAFGRVVWLLFSEGVWGHGERILRIGVVSSVIVAAFAWIYSLPGQQITFDNNRPSLTDYLEFSLATFTNSGLIRWQPDVTTTVWLARLEGVLGLTLFGFFVAALFRRFSRR